MPWIRFALSGTLAKGHVGMSLLLHFLSYPGAIVRHGWP